MRKYTTRSPYVGESRQSGSARQKRHKFLFKNGMWFLAQIKLPVEGDLLRQLIEGLESEVARYKARV